MTSINTIDRLWRRVAVDLGGCWLWLGALDQDGYGQFKFANRQRRAHRFFWEMTNGKISDGMVLDHLCRTKNCVNVLHLEPVSNAENIRRGTAPSMLAKLAGKCRLGHELVASYGGRQRCWTCRDEYLRGWRVGYDAKRRRSIAGDKLREYHREYMREYRRKAKEATT